MAVVCETCGTSNRDAAQYCRGCSSKLPAFYAVPGRATAPASLRGALPSGDLPSGAADGASRGRAAPPSPSLSTRHRLRMHVTPTGLWLTGGLTLALVLAVGLMWFLGQSAAARIKAAASVGAAQAATPSVQASSPTTTSVPSQRSERDAAALAAADAALALLAKPPEPAAPDKPWVASTPPDKTAAARTSAAPARVAGHDPTAQCAELNFFSRAICVNNVCADSAFANSAQCQTARLQRRQDEARRNTPN